MIKVEFSVSFLTFWKLIQINKLSLQGEKILSEYFPYFKSKSLRSYQKSKIFVIANSNLKIIRSQMNLFWLWGKQIFN